MATVYKVWLEIEEFNEQTEDGETLTCLIPCSGTFPTVEEAYAWAQQMHNDGRHAPTSDPDNTKALPPDTARVRPTRDQLHSMYLALRSWLVNEKTEDWREDVSGADFVDAMSMALELNGGGPTRES